MIKTLRSTFAAPAMLCRAAAALMMLMLAATPGVADIRADTLQALREHRSQHARVDDAPTAFVPVAPRRRNSVLRVDGAEQQPALEGTGGLTDENSLLDFGGFGLRFKELHHHIEPPAIDLALLRRLGPPPFVPHGPEAYEALAQIYRQVSEQALALAYAATPEEDE